MRVCRRSPSRANRALVEHECDGRKRCSVDSTGTYGPMDIAGRDHNRMILRFKGEELSTFAYSDGRIAIEIALSLVPETCSTKGCAASSYFMVLRIPSQSVAPLNAFGLRK